MNDRDPIVDALRAGDPDDPRYQPLGRAVSRERGRTRSSWPRHAWVGVRALAGALVVLPMLVMLSAGPPDRLDRIQSDGLIEVLVRADAPQVVVGAGLPEGFDVDVARAVARMLEVRAVVTAADPGQIVAGGWVDRWDLAFDAGILPGEGPSALRLGSPYYLRAGAILVPAESPAGLLADLAGRRACVVAGGPGDRWAAGRLEPAVGSREVPPEAMAVEAVPSLADCVERVRNGVADALIADWEMDVEPLPAGLRRLSAVPFALPAMPAVAADTGGAASLSSAVDRAIEQLRQDGTLRELSERRFGGRDLSDLTR